MTKYHQFFAALFLLLSGCISNRYLLSDKGKDKKFLLQIIKEESRKGEITPKPFIEVDGVSHSYEELKESRLSFSKRDIQKIDVLQREKAWQMYGDAGRNGALVITTNKGKIYLGKPLENRNVLFLLDGREISKSEVEKIDPATIESIDVLKNMDTIKQYTSRSYDGIIIIHLKKTR